MTINSTRRPSATRCGASSGRRRLSHHRGSRRGAKRARGRASIERSRRSIRGSTDDGVRVRRSGWREPGSDESEPSRARISPRLWPRSSSSAKRSKRKSRRCRHISHARRWRPPPATARSWVIRPISTSAIVSPMLTRRLGAKPFCSWGMTSPIPTFGAPFLTRGRFPEQSDDRPRKSRGTTRLFACQSRHQGQSASP